MLLLLSHASRVRLCVTPQTAAHQASVLGILQARTLEWVAISFSNQCRPSQNRSTLSCYVMSVIHSLEIQCFLRL